MRIFPHALVRIAGIAYDDLEQLEIRESKEGIKAYLSLKEEEKALRQTILQELTNEIDSTKDYALKLRLQQLKTTIRYGRTSKSTNFSIPTLNQNLEQQQLLKSKLEEQFQEELLQIRAKFQELSKEEALQKGLLLSSQVLFDKSKRYQSKSPKNFRKKELQIERGLLKYYTRSATKTTPFSTFMNVGIVDFENKKKPLRQITSHIQLNNYLFKHFKELLLQIPIIYYNVKIQVNPTLQIKENTYHFLTNHNNIESFQQIEQQAIVDLILQIFEEQQVLVFKELLEQLLEYIDAEKSSLEGYLNQLINYGLLQFDFGISSNDIDWNNKLIIKLQEYEKLPKPLVTLLNDLKEVERYVKKYALVDANYRRDILSKLFKILRELNTLLVRDFTHLINSDSDFDFKLTNILYEDTCQNSIPSLNQERVFPLMQSIEKLLRQVQHFKGGEREKDKMLAFYKQRYTDNRVLLYQFYEEYARFLTKEKDTKTADFQKGKIKLQENWIKTLGELWKEKNEANFLELLEQVNQKFELSTDSLQEQSHGAFLQFYEKEGQLKAVVNGITTGYGKMMSRFLTMFDKEVTKKLKIWNQGTQHHIFTEIKDASCFNANIHPYLMDYEINLSSSNPKEVTQIPLISIDIHLKNDTLQLRHRETGNEIYTFDFGFQAHESRSKLFQLLAHFGKSPELSLHFITMAINQQVKATELGILVNPRITIENLTIQRKTWWIPKSKLPTKRNRGESDLDFYLKVLEWKNNLALPTEIFITLQPTSDTKEKGKSDNYKPQYISFDNPLLVLLFEKMLLKVSDTIKIVEMLPNKSQLQEIGGKRYAAEYWMSFYS